MGNGGALPPKLAAFVVFMILAVGISIGLMVLYIGEDKPKDRTPSEEVVADDGLTALDAYVKKVDPTYSYRVLHDYTTRNNKSMSFVINMTSQTWMTADVTNRHIWWHYMVITIPDVIDPAYEDVGFLYVTGGSNRNSEPELPSANHLIGPRPNQTVLRADCRDLVWRGGWRPTSHLLGFYVADPRTDAEAELTIMAAESLNAVGAMMRQNPNQPILFANDPTQKSRSEDDIIAYTFRQYVGGPFADDPEIVLQLPMTKAVIRALDTMTRFSNSKIQRFYVAGASKRGWATWLAGIVDDRIVGIAPMVLTLLNMSPNFDHHYRSLTGWSFAIEPYWAEDCMRFLNDPEAVKLLTLVDPYEYRHRLTKPKYVISASSDEFFLPDDHHYWYNGMKGVTMLRIHPNAEHSLAGHWRRMTNEVVAFIHWNEAKWEWPTITWTRSQNSREGSIMVKTSKQPTVIKAWSADTTQEERRDWRLAIAREINTTDLKPQAILYRDVGVGNPDNNVYKAVVPMPTSGWNCFFIEMCFLGPKGSEIVFTTEVNIIPDTFPYESCKGDECIGRLV